MAQSTQALQYGRGRRPLRLVPHFVGGEAPLSGSATLRNAARRTRLIRALEDALAVGPEIPD
jgi:hypothetical protein